MEKQEIVDLINKGYSTRKIADELKTSQTNIRYWITKYNLKTLPKLFENDFDIHQRCLDLISNNKILYNYLFGLYLGDGHTYKIKDKRNLYCLCITQDLKYPKLIEEISDSMEKFFNLKVQVLKRNNANCVSIKVFSNTIKFLFPKYGVGNKHLNKVELPDFILKNIDYLSLTKGLFHSDGSYYYSKHAKKYYYSFSNMSIDICDIYTMCLDKLGIKYDVSVKNTNAINVNVRSNENISKFRDIIGVK